MHLGCPGQRIVENERRVINHFENHPRTSTRVAAQHSGLSHLGTVRRTPHITACIPFIFKECKSYFHETLDLVSNLLIFFCCKNKQSRETFKDILFSLMKHTLTHGDNFHNWTADNSHGTHKHVVVTNIVSACTFGHLLLLLDPYTEYFWRMFSLVVRKRSFRYPPNNVVSTWWAICTL